MKSIMSDNLSEIERDPMVLVVGAVNSVINLGRIANGIIHFDPHPDAEGPTLLPGMSQAIQEIRIRRRG